MAPSSPVDQRSFRRILARNIVLPLAFGVINAAVFIVLIAFLLDAFRWVEHTESVLAKSNEVSRLMVDMQTGLRGFLITGEEPYLGIYRLARPKIAPELTTLREMVSDNKIQVDRLRRIEAMHGEWVGYSESAIELRRNDGDYRKLVSSRGQQEFNEIRREFADFQDMENNFLADRREDARSVTTVSIISYLILMAVVTGFLC